MIIMGKGPKGSFPQFLKLNSKIMDPNVPVREIMTTKIITVFEDDSLHKVDSVFGEFRFHHLPVIEKGNRLVGIITREDFYKRRPERKGGKASHVMTKYPMELDPEDSIGLAADIFLTNHFHSLPVVEDGQLIGIVTTHDLLQFSFRSPIESIPDHGDDN